MRHFNNQYGVKDKGSTRWTMFFGWHYLFNALLSKNTVFMILAAIIPNPWSDTYQLPAHPESLQNCQSSVLR